MFSLVSRTLDLNSMNSKQMLRCLLSWARNFKWKSLWEWYLSYFNHLINFASIDSHLRSSSIVLRSTSSFVVVHFWPVTIVIKLKSFCVALVLMNFPCFAIKAVRWESVMWLREMIHEIVNGFCCKFRFAGIAKVHDGLSV